LASVPSPAGGGAELAPPARPAANAHGAARVSHHHGRVVQLEVPLALELAQRPAQPARLVRVAERQHHHVRHRSLSRYNNGPDPARRVDHHSDATGAAPG
jgi:hypothetical protein